MRRRLVATAALVLVLAGCATPATEPPGPAGPAAAGPRIVPEGPVAIAANAWRDREADVAISPVDPLHVAVFYNERPQPYVTGAIVTDPITPGILRQALAVSRDGGATWAVSRLPHAGTAAPGSAWGAFCAMGDPNVMFDAAGVIHVVTLFIECGGPLLGSANGILHATTEDDGATWSEPDVAWVGAGGFAGIFHDREWSAYDPLSGTIGIAWTGFGGAGLRQALSVIFSTDGGRAWSLPEEVQVGDPTNSPGANFLVHATWAADGLFHVTTYGCITGDAVQGGGGGSCLWHFRGIPGAEWFRSDLPLGACVGAPAGGTFDYATSAADFERGRLFAGSVVIADGAPQGLCVFASDDGGATWPRAGYLAGADHPWLAVAPDGQAALAYVALNGTVATPHLALLDPGTLQVTSTVAQGPAFEADTDGDGALEFGDYDAMAARDGRYLWALTQPNQEGRKAGDTFNDLDVHAYYGRLT